MNALRTQLAGLLQGRVCLLGVGNTAYGDDGFGVRLAETLAARGVPNVVVAGNTPERWLGHVAEEQFDCLVFLDAVDFGAQPGSLVLMDSNEIGERFPQISTHKLSLGLLARAVEENGTTRAWLLGAQPESLRAGELSPALETTRRAICELLCDVIAGGVPAQGRAS